MGFATLGGKLSRLVQAEIGYLGTLDVLPNVIGQIVNPTDCAEIPIEGQHISLPAVSVHYATKAGRIFAGQHRIEL